mmetsp:Transcript_61031/g.125868  ORF Transcript_61031/g.125868 Transcript_61031/m.125868 type:complete len:80 (+) Transcript_61031:1036-1275(+)
MFAGVRGSPWSAWVVQGLMVRVAVLADSGGPELVQLAGKGAFGTEVVLPWRVVVELEMARGMLRLMLLGWRFRGGQMLR